MDGGKTWVPAEIVHKRDQDYVWVYWEASVVPLYSGVRTVYASAVASDGSIQPDSDDDYLDGTNSWSSVKFSVIENY